jgi:putative ABC transport system permease protein
VATTTKSVKTTQLTRFAVDGLWRQKVRTALTLIGVIVGTCALVFSLSLGLGLRAFVEHEFKSRQEFWRITVRAPESAPDPAKLPPEKIAVTGNLSEARKARIRESLIEKHLSNSTAFKPPLTLTPEKNAEIAALAGVAEVRTYRSREGRIWHGERPTPTIVVTGPLATLKPQLVAGQLPGGDQPEMAVTEFALYEAGFRSEAEFDGIVGQKIAVEVGGVHNTKALSLARTLTGRFQGNVLNRIQSEALEKVTAELPRKLHTFDLSPAELAGLKVLLHTKPERDERPWESAVTVRGVFTVTGVLRRHAKDERKDIVLAGGWELQRGEVFLTGNTGEQLVGQLPWMKDVGVFHADVIVKPGEDLPRVVADIEAMGFETYSSLKWFSNAKREMTMIAGGLNLFALVALFVAGIGITNTLVTSVVERTREIGILKAVGATRGQVQGIFLAEGVAIGLAGAALGLALARLLTIPADRWVHALISKQTNGEPLVTQTIFVFPWWLWASAVLFAVVVTTAAAYYPARRAARIHPIEALRYG